MYAKEMQTANSYMTDPSEEIRDRYWQVGVQDLKYQMEDFKNEEIGFSFTNVIIKNENSLNFIKNSTVF